MFVEYPVNWQLEKCSIKMAFFSVGRHARKSPRYIYPLAHASIGDLAPCEGKRREIREGEVFATRSVRCSLMPSDHWLDHKNLDRNGIPKAFVDHADVTKKVTH